MLGAVYLPAFTTRLWSPWRHEVCPLHHCTLKVGTGGFWAKPHWPTASMREGLWLLGRGSCHLQGLISHHRFTVNPESHSFSTSNCKLLRKTCDVWESHPDVKGRGSMSEGPVSTCRDGELGSDTVLSSLHHLLSLLSPPPSHSAMGQETSHSVPGTLRLQSCLCR